MLMWGKIYTILNIQDDDENVSNYIKKSLKNRISYIINTTKILSENLI
jgi:hypothetical protein